MFNASKNLKPIRILSVDNQTIISIEPLVHFFIGQGQRWCFYKEVSKPIELVINPILGHDQASTPAVAINARTSDSRQQVVREPNLIGEGNFPFATPSHQELFEMGK
jgi:hypothetical protein